MPIWLTVLPWRFLSGLSCGAFVVFLWHDASVTRIELKQAQDKAQATLEQSIVVTQADAKASKELSDAQAVTADLLASNKRLSVRASCVPASSDPGVDHGEIAILNQDARRAYFAHRELIVKKDAQIRGLQEIVRGLSSSARQD
jgi:hypothetical protein